MFAPQLDPNSLEFPPVDLALDEPNGLLAWGGDLMPGRLQLAYRSGIFPWFVEGQPILWWSPDPRAVLFTDRLHVSRSLRKRLRRGDYRVTLNQAFEQVIDLCQAPAPGREETWITGHMRAAYLVLHELGEAHSVECWDGEVLCGGLYGVSVGRIFCGESMFSRSSDASKVALVHLMEHLKPAGFEMIDCQVPNEHLSSLGAESIPRPEFIQRLHAGRDQSVPKDLWKPGLLTLDAFAPGC